METLKQSGLWSSLGIHGFLVVIWWLCISGHGEARKFGILSKIWAWKSWSIASQNNRDLNQGILHLWPKFGDPSLNWWWVMVWTSSKWGKFWLLAKFDLEGQGLLPPKTIGTLSMVFYTYGLNLVILAWTGDSFRADKHMITAHTKAQRQMQAKTIPKAQNWPRVIKSAKSLSIFCIILTFILLAYINNWLHLSQSFYDDIYT